MAYLYTNGALTTSVQKGFGWKGVAGNEYLGQTTDISDKQFNGTLYYVYIFKSALSDTKRSSIESGAYGISELSFPKYLALR